MCVSVCVSVFSSVTPGFEPRSAKVFLTPAAVLQEHEGCRGADGGTQPPAAQAVEGDN